MSAEERGVIWRWLCDVTVSFVVELNLVVAPGYWLVWGLIPNLVKKKRTLSLRVSVLMGLSLSLSLPKDWVNETVLSRTLPRPPPRPPCSHLPPSVCCPNECDLGSVRCCAPPPCVVVLDWPTYQTFLSTFKPGWFLYTWSLGFCSYLPIIHCDLCTFYFLVLDSSVVGVCTVSVALPFHWDFSCCKIMWIKSK